MYLYHTPEFNCCSVFSPDNFISFMFYNILNMLILDMVHLLGLEEVDSLSLFS